MAKWRDYFAPKTPPANGDNEPEMPPELEGMTPDDIAKFAKRGKELADVNVDELRGKATEADTLRAKIAEMELNRQAPPPPNNQPPKRTSFLEDEDQAFNERAAPLVGVLAQVGRTTARQEFVGGLSGVERRIFDKYGKELDEIMGKEQATVQINPEAWRNGFALVKGRHMDDILKARSENSDFFAETAGNTGSGAPPVVVVDRNVLTEDDKKAAKKYGLTEAEMLEAKKSMEVVSGGQ